MSFFDPSQWDGKLYSSGWIASAGGSQDVMEPATESAIGRVGVANTEDVARAVEVAVKAQKAWAATSYEERAAVLRRAGDLLEANAAVSSDWLIREAGSAKGKAAFESHMVSGIFYAAAAVAQAPYGQLLRSAKPRLSLARRIPVGVVGVISPFNFPQILSMRSVAPALALGNAVILKPDPRTAVTGGVTIARIFEEAGLPAGLLHVLPGAADVGEAMITHPLVRVISFTGSSNAGRRVGELAGRNLKRVHLELGGNSAMIVLDDADVDEAVNLAAWGSFFHQGQICMTTGRHLVHESLYDDFVERLSAKAGQLPVGDPARQEVALGPVIDANQRDKIHSLVTASTGTGARIAAGGSYDNLFYSPTVVADASLDTPAFAEEIFGPVAPVARFSSGDDAARLAAVTDYGLSLGIVTRDVMKGLALAEQLPSGIVHINNQTVNDEANAPFGGVGASGTGSRFGGAAANVDAFTETQWVTVRGQAAAYPF